MPQEIERKFLVLSDAYKATSFAQTRITQGYLSSAKERTVRIRIKDSKGYITIKGATNQNGLSRYEWEKEIAINDAEELLKICEPGVIDKIRYEVKCGKHIVEVDEFLGENNGLVVAEIELEYESEAFEKPTWLGREVTGDAKYYNSQLIKNPYSKW